MSDNEQDADTTWQPKIDNLVPEDTIRILLATDNHIGVNERDPIRGQDSINTFQEILQLAVKHEVDFVLLAGDLFHENKPSRDSLYQTMALLREYTLGDKPVQIELLSDPEEGKAAGYSFPAVNYEDPNFNVGIPVFSIHGNHDDPQGVGAEGALCALDVLSVSGLINYMGKFDLAVDNVNPQSDGTNGITVRPVLLRKGKTLLGMYGVGNVKDSRMHFELRSNRVKMYMPRNKNDWFNILLVHQNRVKHGPQEYVPEGMFDDAIDLVVWGHEHDCRIMPEEVAGKKYHISQPGSSVATSLAEGEAIEKHVALVQVQGKQYTIEPIPLRTVRPFVLDQVVLTDAAEDEGLDLSSQIEIGQYLKGKVNALIEKAHQQWDERNARAVAAGEKELPAMLPIIRLKVDTSGVLEMSNPIRFGQEFQGRIANPRDLLVFHRKTQRQTRSKIKADEPELSIDDPDLTASEKLAKVRVANLVKEYLQAQELQLLGESGMSDAIQVFVDKDDIHSIQTHVSKTLKTMLKSVQADGDMDEDALEELLMKAKEQQEEEYITKKKEKAPKKSKKDKAAEDDEDAKSVDSMAMDDDLDVGGNSDIVMDSDEEEPAPKKKAPAKKAPAKKAAPKKAPAKTKGKGKSRAVADDSEEEEAELIDDDSVEEEDPPPKKKTSRAAVLSQPAKRAPAKKAPAKSKQTTLAFTPATTSRTSGRAAVTKARGKITQMEDLDDE